MFGLTAMRHCNKRMAAEGVLAKRTGAMCMDQLPIDGMEKTVELALAAPSRLEVTWTYDPLTSEITSAYAMYGAGEDLRAAWGESVGPTTSGWEFAEAGWLVHKLRELKARTVPF